jgi:hypothetical protein
MLRYVSRVPLLVAIPLLAASCVVAQPAVVTGPPPPPPPQVEVVPGAPGPAYVWVPGHWAWRPRVATYVWVPGFYAIPQPGYVYAPGHWVPRGGGHVWIEGRWRLR